MRSYARVSLLALIIAATTALSASAAQAAPELESVFASNCKVNTCKKNPGESKAEELAKAEAEGFTQAAGHPNFGITDFKIKTAGTFPNEAPEGAAEGEFITHIRTDVAPGVATNPEAPEKCSFKEFGQEFEPAPGVHTGLFEAPTCAAGSEIGVNNVIVWLGPKPSPEGGDLPIEGKVYNLVQPTGLASDFGVALPLPKALTEEIIGIPTPQLYAHTLIEGNVEWGKQKKGTEKGDYHDYFEINVSAELPLISSRLTFNGRAGTGGAGDFLTNPTSCTGIGPQTTTTLKLDFAKGGTAKGAYETPIGTEGCTSLIEPIPFSPTLELAPATTQLDEADAVTVGAKLPHFAGATGLTSSQLKTATLELPEGMTLNPSAAAGKTACTKAQAHIHAEEKGIGCPESSKVGTVALNVPGLPAGSLTGSMYLGGPETNQESATITEPKFVMYFNAESERYGIDVRLKALVTANRETGRVTAAFTENPEQPFTEAVMKFETPGVPAPVANPLVCGPATSSATFSPYTGTAPVSPLVTPFSVDGNGSGGACASPLPFAPTQSTTNQNGSGGGNTSFTLSLERQQGQQYLSKVSTTLPAGLAGAIPNATQCAEPGASKGECPSTSQIGTAAVLAGSGATPFTFSGPVYLTGPYNGAPFGMSIAVPAVAGPFNLGTVVTRATINVDPHTAQVTVASTLPRIFEGVPLRLRRILVSVNKQGFLLNPTSCNALSTESTLTGFTPGSSTEATFKVATPFQLANCSALGFTPKFIAKTSGKPSKANGASIETTLNYTPGQANTKSVLVQLPKQLPSRLTTLQKACAAATFEANPFNCPSGSFVGGARANTPLLPGKLTGPAILVSHAGAAFPDLDLVMEANGVRVILVGNTNIKKGITTTNFATTPDAPVSSVTVNLPLGPHSALATERTTTNLCTAKLVMPTTITAQNGKQFKQNTIIQPQGCGVQIVGHKVSGNTAILKVKTFAAGRISGSGSGLKTVYRHLKGANGAATLNVPLTSGGRNRRPFKTKIRVGFLPKKPGAHSTSSVTVSFG